MLPGDGPPSIGKRDFFVVTGKRKDNAECANTWHFILFSGEKKNKKAERWIHQVRPCYLSIGVYIDCGSLITNCLISLALF
jgi:hypothetical protein